MIKYYRSCGHRFFFKLYFKVFPVQLQKIAFLNFFSKESCLSRFIVCILLRRVENSMWRSTAKFLKLPPRYVAPTPPPLTRRPGKFKCSHCGYHWTSPNVWVTMNTGVCFQGESCDQCGTTEKPFYIGYWTESVFDKAHGNSLPHAVKHRASSKYSLRKHSHSQGPKHSPWKFHTQRFKH